MSLWDVVADLCSPEQASDPAEWLTLIQELPDTSAFAASVQGGREYRGWGTQRYIDAATFDAIQVLTYITARANGAKKAKEPQPWPRPGAARRKPRQRTLAQLAAERRKGGR